MATKQKSKTKAKKPNVVEQMVLDTLASSEVQTMVDSCHEEGKAGSRRSDAWTKKRIDIKLKMEQRRNKKGNYFTSKVTSLPSFGRSAGTAKKVGDFLRANALRVPKDLHVLPSGLPLVPKNYDGVSVDPDGSLTAAKTRATAIVPDDVLALAKVVAHAMTLPDAPVKALRSFLKVLCADHIAIGEAVNAAEVAVLDDGGSPIEGKKYPGVLLYKN